MAAQNYIFTQYANDKFELLNQFRVFITKEQVIEAINLPETVAKKGKYLIYKKDRVVVIIKKEGGINKIITFYPTVSNN